MITSKVSPRWQTTLPAEIRARLEIQPGDRLAYEPSSKGVHLRRLPRPDPAQAAPSRVPEWNSPEDTEDFQNL